VLWVLRSSSSTESKDQMESGATFELVFASGLVVVPVHLMLSVVCSSSLTSWMVLRTYICLPPKMRRCCAGGMPSFSSTRSLMRETCGWRFVSRIVLMVWRRMCGHGSVKGDIRVKSDVVLCSRAQCRAQSPCRSGCALYKGVVSC